MNEYVKRLRLAGADALGRKLTQQEAGELIGAGPRNWYNWESGSREINQTAVELFCLKTGLEFSPGLMTGETEPKKVKPKLRLVPKNIENSHGFLTVTDVKTHMTVTFNTALIKIYRFNRETKGTSIHLITDDIIEAEEKISDLDSVLGTASIVSSFLS